MILRYRNSGSLLFRVWSGSRGYYPPPPPRYITVPFAMWERLFWQACLPTAIGALSGLLRLDLADNRLEEIPQEVNRTSTTSKGAFLIPSSRCNNTGKPNRRHCDKMLNQATTNIPQGVVLSLVRRRGRRYTRYMIREKIYHQVKHLKALYRDWAISIVVLLVLVLQY